VRKNGGQIDQPLCLVDGSRLYRGDLMLAQGLADDIEPARQRRVTEALYRTSTVSRSNRRDQRLLRIDELGLRFGERRREARYGWTGPMHGSPPR
jgi:hypothetical protein